MPNLSSDIASVRFGRCATCRRWGGWGRCSLHTPRLGASWLHETGYVCPFGVYSAAAVLKGFVVPPKLDR